MTPARVYRVRRCAFRSSDYNLARLMASEPCKRSRGSVSRKSRRPDLEERSQEVKSQAVSGRRRKRPVFVVGLAGVKAVVQLAEEFVEQVSLGRFQSPAARRAS